MEVVEGECIINKLYERDRAGKGGGKVQVNRDDAQKCAHPRGE